MGDMVTQWVASWPLGCGFDSCPQLCASSSCLFARCCTGFYWVFYSGFLPEPKGILLYTLVSLNYLYCMIAYTLQQTGTPFRVFPCHVPHAF